MTIDDVPADTVVELTAELDRLFKAVGCKPACHACKTKLAIGDRFQLLSYQGIDEMVCATCDRDALKKRDDDKEVAKAAAEVKRAENLKAHIAWKHSQGLGGYSRPSATAAEPPGGA